MLNYLNKYESQDTNPSPFLDAKGTLDEGGQFDYRMFANVTYAAGDWSAGAAFPLSAVCERWFRGSQSGDADPRRRLVQLVDVFGSFRVRESISLRAGIDNLLDPEPEIVGELPGINNNSGNTLPGFYDILGRRYLGRREL